MRTAEARLTAHPSSAARPNHPNPLRHRLEYYEALLRILEAYGCADGARCFAYAAIAELDTVYGPADHPAAAAAEVRLLPGAVLSRVHLHPAQRVPPPSSTSVWS